MGRTLGALRLGTKSPIYSRLISSNVNPKCPSSKNPKKNLTRLNMPPFGAIEAWSRSRTPLRSLSTNFVGRRTTEGHPFHCQDSATAARMRHHLPTRGSQPVRLTVIRSSFCPYPRGNPSIRVTKPVISPELQQSRRRDAGALPLAISDSFPTSSFESNGQDYK
jgi:hypothetical protein